jgi:hypothetical protein
VWLGQKVGLSNHCLGAWIRRDRKGEGEGEGTTAKLVDMIASCISISIDPQSADGTSYGY